MRRCPLCRQLIEIGLLATPEEQAAFDAEFKEELRQRVIANAAGLVVPEVKRDPEQPA